MNTAAVLVGWGSSSMAGIGPAMDTVLRGTGTRFVNEGSGGETSHQTCARIGAIPAMLTFPDDTVPPSGTTPVGTPTLMQRGASLKPVAGEVGGVAGVLAWQRDRLEFARSSPGAAVRVAPAVPFRPVFGRLLGGQDSLVWVGKNDLVDGATATEVVARTSTTVEWLQSRGARVLILGHFVNTRSPADVTQPVLAVNAALEDLYDLRYLDVQRLLVDPGLWQSIGLTPTADDLAEQSAGHKPPSISTDDGHLDTTGYLFVAASVHARLKRLGWL